MNPTVYLAGPIAGRSYDGATTWRDNAVRLLAAHGIDGLSPMRAKEYLRGVERDTGFSATCDEYGHFPMSSPRAIMTRDRFDATRCDVLLVNLLGAERISVGTVMEIAWADLRRTPIVAVIEPDGSNVHEHAMVGEAIGFRAATLEQGIEIVAAILARPGQRITQKGC